MRETLILMQWKGPGIIFLDVLFFPLITNPMPFISEQLWNASSLLT